MALANFIFSLFVLFTIVVKESSLHKFNTDVTIFVQSKADHYLDALFSWVSIIGRIEVSLVFLLLFLFIIKKQQRVPVILLFGITHAIEVFLKFSIQHASPPFQFYRYQVGENLLDSYTIPGFSYPSGHAARATFILMILLYAVIGSKNISFMKKNIIISLLVPFFMAVFISKIYLGEHWTSDIIGGILLGLTFAILAHVLYIIPKKD